MESGWCYGENDRTGRKGDFPAECVYVLPATSKPATDIVVRSYYLGNAYDHHFI